jgi:hypothetical protein
MFMVSAIIVVSKTKEINPCKSASRLNLREVICTSDTWKVIPKTKEK